MIVQAVLTGYRIKEFIQFIGNALIITNQYNPATLKIIDQYQALDNIYQQLLQSYQQATVSDTATQLAKLDTRRDQALICLRMLSEAYIRHHEEERQAAGKQMMACINKYGPRVYHLNYSAETAAIKNLIRDFETVPAYGEAIKLLGLGSTVREMKQANQKFEQLFIKRLGEISQKNSPSARQLVRQVAEAYRTLVKHVEAHITLTPSATYTPLIDHLNENTEHFNQMVERRKVTSEATKATSNLTG